MKFTLRKIKSETNLLLKRNKSRVNLHELDDDVPAVPDLPPRLPMPECLITRVSLLEIEGLSITSSPMSAHVTTLSLGELPVATSPPPTQRYYDRPAPEPARSPTSTPAALPSELYMYKLQLEIEKEMAKRAMAAWKFPTSPSRRPAETPACCAEPYSRPYDASHPQPRTGYLHALDQAQWREAQRRAPAPPPTAGSWPTPARYTASAATHGTASGTALPRREVFPPSLGRETIQDSPVCRGRSLRDAHVACQAVFPRPAPVTREAPAVQYATPSRQAPPPPPPPAAPARPWSPFRNPRPPPRPPQEPPADGPAPVLPVPPREIKQAVSAATAASPATPSSSASSRWKFGWWGKSTPSSSERDEAAKRHVRRSSSFYVPEPDLDAFPLPPERIAQPDLPPWSAHVLDALLQGRSPQPAAATVMRYEDPFFSSSTQAQQTLPVEYEMSSPVITPGSIDFSAPRPGYRSARESQRGLSTPPSNGWASRCPTTSSTAPREAPVLPSHVRPRPSTKPDCSIDPKMYMERRWDPPCRDVTPYSAPVQVQQRRRSHTMSAVQPANQRRTRQPGQHQSRWPPS